MQPVTPLRQQQQHNLNSRPRRSITATTTIGESSSRRSSRLQATINEGIAPCNPPVMLQYDLLKNPPTPPPRRRDHNSTTTTVHDREDSLLAPPLALQSRKRTRSEVQADEEEHGDQHEDYDQGDVPELEHFIQQQDRPSASVTLDEAQAQIRALAEYIKQNREGVNINGSSKRESAFRQAALAIAKVGQGAEDAIREAWEEMEDGAEMDEDQQAALDQLDEFAGLRDLFANGRALYNATTTSLAAPAEIPNKKPRLSRDEAIEAAGPSNANNNNIKRSAVHLDNALATPKQTSRAPTESGSRRPTSKRTAAVTAATAISNNSTSKRRSASRTTTAGGDSAAKRISKAQRDDERRHQQEQDALDWKKKYKRAFKSFVFYFDGFDAARKREAEKCVKDLGAQVESFFSKQVSHVVTTRPIPLPERASSALNAPAASASLAASTKANIFQAPSTHHQASGKENAQHHQVRNSSESPLKQTAAARDAFAGPSRRSKTRLGAANPNNIGYPVKTPPKIKAFADFEKTESKDILVKAQSFGMKLWNVEKLQRVLERLMSDDSPQTLVRQGLIVNNAAHIAAGHAFNLQMNGNAPRPTLPSLLRAEALTGSTYERDLNALRPDFHYFNPKNGYILVEDTSGEFQPAHAKEYSQRIYSKPGDEGRDTEWPTLWGGQEGRQAFYKASSSYKPSLPSMDLILSNERGCAPKADTPLRPKRHTQQQNSQIADPPSYLAASGNSQIITSNIQSGTSTRSGQVFGANGTKTTANTIKNGVIVNKRLARLGSKNAHVVTIGNNNSKYTQQSSTVVATTHQSSSVASELARRARHAELKSNFAAMQATIDDMRERRKASMPPKPEPKKPGYCENCRVRFEDFKTHTRTKKHRRFALDQSNWTQLDELFSKIRRPINAELLELYADADMQNDIPSDIEASDKEEEEEEEEEYSDEDDLIEENDSGYASNSYDFMPAACDARRRKSRHSNPDQDEDHHDVYAAPGQATNRRLTARSNHLDRGEESEDEDNQGNTADNGGDDDEEEEDDEVVGTSEEEEALETASEDDEMSEEEA